MRVMPEVCGVFESMSQARTIFIPCSFQSIFGPRPQVRRSEGSIPQQRFRFNYSDKARVSSKRGMLPMSHFHATLAGCARGTEAGKK
jgi:hypothetical protein